MPMEPFIEMFKSTWIKQLEQIYLGTVFQIDF